MICPNTRGGARLLQISISFLVLATATRVGLALFSDSTYDAQQWVRFMGVGFLYDVLVLPCFLLPWAVYDAVTPEFGDHPRLRRVENIWAFFWGTSFMLLFLAVAVSEFAFWGEFSSRFDFIAVDYLIYTHEVIGNIMESYPVPLWLGGISTVALVICVLTWPRFRDKKRTTWRWRWARATVTAIATIVGIGLLDFRHAEDDHNAFVGQLSLNGVYAFAHAFRHNELDYEKYYPTLAAGDLDREIRSLLKQTNVRFEKPQGIDRQIAAYHAPRKVNVILISVESLSAEYLAHFGNAQGLTPELDRLADQGLLFSKFYATGTRTVRGLEALSVGTPPTPGQSIVRRPNNDNLENLGEELGEHGWVPYWIYGGYGFFDNMNAYFAANHYIVADRTSIGTEGLPIHHENIWGVADEDLYTLALLNMDRTHAAGKLFFAHIMTTSNHRPYTFPAKRIDMPQKKRDSAVKYTDWAIGDFIRRASEKPWFKDTVFIVTGDHTAKAAGKNDLPPSRYHIPLIWYAPAHIAPARNDRLMSQIDLPTTLMGWLGMSYDSRFFGYDLFNLEAGRERAFISTYQKLGYLKDGRLVVLDVRKQPAVGPGLDPRPDTKADDQALVNEAIAWYQSSSRAFRDNLLKDPDREAKPARN